MKKYLVLFLMIISLSLNALSMEWGNLKVTADEKTGGFVLFGRISSDSSWRSLLVESYTSSYLALSLDGEESILNGNRNYTVRFEQTETEVTIISESHDIRVEQHIILHEPEGGIPYLVLTDKIINNSKDRRAVGLKRVLDTVFIRGNTHYLVQGKPIENEILYSGESMPELILSQGKEPGEKLYIAPQWEGSPAERLLMGNWNRIDREDWNYTPSEQTNFNSLPFSINDSALAFYKEPENLTSGSSQSITFALGTMDFTGQIEIDHSPEEPQYEPSAVTYPQKNSSLALIHLEEQLEYLNILMKDIDRLIKKGQDVSNEEILAMEERIEILEQKKREYEEIQ